jgi:L-ribulose-5-phosphate 3-epimerase
MNKIGIMQGRLSLPTNTQIQSFPINHWEEEFEKASKIGFTSIEWIFDTLSPNPIVDKMEIRKIDKLSSEFEISINSLCADFFMENKLFNVSEKEISSNLEILKILIENCSELEINILEIPLVDSSSIKNELFEKEFVNNLNKIIPIAEKNNVILTLETDLPPARFNLLLSDLKSPYVAANYDIGNSTSLGYDPALEFRIMGKWIKNIHIKDRIINGNTVPLGKGNANFELFFSLLSQIEYSNDLIIQGAREDLINSNISPELTCEKYFNFVKNHIKE